MPAVSDPVTGVYSFGNHIAKVVAHGLAGGISSFAMGGKFRQGFLSAATAQAFAPGVDRLDSNNAGVSSVRVVAAAVAGGTAAEIGGGKFANGAVTAAFSRAYNDERRYTKIRQEAVADRMVRLGFESDSRQGLFGGIGGVIRDVVGLFKAASFDIEFGKALYRREVTYQNYEDTYESGTTNLVSTRVVGPQYTVWEMTGSSIPGFTYEGNGIYSRPASSSGGAVLEGP
ncbi:MAG: hypothetical protein HYV18_05660 [Gammaproteobacteria bacterium]|nr:hypothetical protein [Gammaproteobacteria bacterium]